MFSTVGLDPDHSDMIDAVSTTRKAASRMMKALVAILKALRVAFAPAMAAFEALPVLIRTRCECAADLSAETSGTATVFDPTTPTEEAKPAADLSLAKSNPCSSPWPKRS